VICDARAFHKHPAEIVGRPETMAAACWRMWRAAAEWAEQEAGEQIRGMQQQMSETMRQAVG
jgi:hypothetical protein